MLSLLRRQPRLRLCADADIRNNIFFTRAKHIAQAWRADKTMHKGLNQCNIRYSILLFRSATDDVILLNCSLLKYTDTFSLNSYYPTETVLFSLLPSFTTYLLTFSIQHSPSWGADQFSANQEIPRILRTPKVHYRIHKWTPSVPILRQLDPVRPLIPLPEDPSLYNPPIYVRVCQVVSFPQGCPTYTRCSLSSPPYALHAPHISTWSPAQYLVSSTDH